MRKYISKYTLSYIFFDANYNIRYIYTIYSFFIRASSNNSSISSFKSLDSPLPIQDRVSTSKSQSEILSPVSPAIQSPISDSVFTPSTPRESNLTQGTRPDGWPGMTDDEKLTTVIKSLISLTIAVAGIPEIKTQQTALSTKLDALTDSLNKLQDENAKNS